MSKQGSSSSVSLSELTKNQKIFEISPEAIILLDAKGNVLDANQRLGDWLGYSTSEVTGLHVSKFPFLPKKSKLLALAQFTKRMSGQKVLPYELEFTAKDGSIKIGLIQAVPIVGEKGKNIADLVMVSDITDRKQAEDRLAVNTQELERLNKLMLGREYKMAELKEKLKDNRGGVKRTGVRRLLSKLVLNLSKKIIGVFLTNSFFQVMVAIAVGIYVSLIVILFSAVDQTLAIVITSFVTLFGLAIIWMSVFLKTKFNSGDSDYLTRKAMLNVLEDISEEKDYGEMKNRSVLENIGEGIVITDEKGFIAYINPAFENFLGCFGKDIIGKDFAETITMFDLKGQEIPVHERSDSAAVTAKNQQIKVLIKCVEGEQKAFSLNAAPIKVGDQFRGVVRVVHNISEDFKLQQQKDDFFSIASHELRTPLTVIAGNIDIVLQGYGKSHLSHDDKQLLTDVETAADRLINMVNEFLNVSRIDQGRLKATIVEVDACELAADVVKEITPLAKEKGITLEYSCAEDNEKVMADEGFVKEILINLIGNSIKFTKQGGIKVEQVTEDGWLITTVIDTGMGIAQDRQDLLFARFQQAMSRTMTREAGGTGLGLYISREFSRMMGGDLTLISSQEGEGSSFSFNLPLASSNNIETLQVND